MQKSRRYLHVFVCFCFIRTARCSVMDPVAHCPAFVDEGKDLDCECSARSPDMRGSTRFWPGVSSTSKLTVKDVSRRDNGTEYVCQMDWRGSTYRTKYTLQVAYGPSDSTVEVKGPPFFATNGSRTLSLPCIVDEVNPNPVITWLFEPCNHGIPRVNCTFKPQPPRHDGVNITCRAMNAKTRKLTVGTADFTLRLKYPPTKAPEIWGHRARQIHKTGDRISCIVSGGKPLVAKVVFSCSDPPHKDQEDVFGEYNVSSYLTLNSSEPRNSETVCTCFAIWEEQPDQYTLKTIISFAIQQVPEPPAKKLDTVETPPDCKVKQGNKGFIVATIVLSISLLLFLVAGIILWTLSQRNCAMFKKDRGGLPQTVPEKQRLLCATDASNVTQHSQGQREQSELVPVSKADAQSSCPEQDARALVEGMSTSEHIAPGHAQRESTSINQQHLEKGELTNGCGNFDAISVGAPCSDTTQLKSAPSATLKISSDIVGDQPPAEAARTVDRGTRKVTEDSIDLPPKSDGVDPLPGKDLKNNDDACSNKSQCEGVTLKDNQAILRK